MTRRCVRGHFIPATAETTACRRTLVPRQRREHRFTVDIWGQGLATRRKPITTTWSTGSYL
ncbi:hypothetical protein GKQ77_01835 [Streptomyces sp. BG9H]|uniref:Uncharacterized protein n=1 Tax=Streptomyces anatolicus TaxID=2675858 RepID=A0ABS6YIA0_9ACTN|nr:hypothetical protein [Streptomyces anatolicus]MBW5420312.1 hypothetical protein [Streptomyces anatolicus]